MYDQYGNKLVRKAIPYQLYDMAGLQQWFEEMSAKGFLLDSFGIRTGIFRVGEPAPGVRYRLEPQTYWDQSLDYDKNEAYAKMGWEYVDFIGHYYYIYRAEDPETEELHTDPMTQSYVFDRYLKRYLRAFFAFLVLALGQLAYTIGFDRDSLTLTLPNFLEQLVLDTQYVVPFLLADLWSLLVITPVVYFRFWKLWKLRDQLAMGVPWTRESGTPAPWPARWPSSPSPSPCGASGLWAFSFRPISRPPSPRTGPPPPPCSPCTTWIWTRPFRIRSTAIIWRRPPSRPWLSSRT